MTSCFGVVFQLVARIVQGLVGHLDGEEGVKEYGPHLPLQTVSDVLSCRIWAGDDHFDE
jgi:hypothetical protein